MYVTLLIGYATGKHTHTRTRTTGATVAPIAKPYREQIDCGIIYKQVNRCQKFCTASRAIESKNIMRDFK